jgi:hypothetical protein
MGIAADWHLQDLPTAERTREYDPFSDPAYSAPLPPIDISTGQAQLDEHLTSLLDQEARLFDEGITCPIKDTPDATCLACPVSSARDYADPKGQLCRVGQEEERVLTVMVAKRHDLN